LPAFSGAAPLQEGDHGIMVKNTFISIFQGDAEEEFFRTSPSGKAIKRSSSTPLTISLPNTAMGKKPPQAQVGGASPSPGIVEEAVDQRYRQLGSASVLWSSS